MNSRQGSRYIKNRMGNDLKEKILEQNGIRIDKSKTNKATAPVDCPRCELVNPFENKFSKSVQGTLRSLSSTISSFASRAESDLRKVASAANSARSAFNRMASAARSVARAARSARSAGAMHGGSFMTFNAQHDGQFIADHRQKVNGITVGEFNKPELVTVEPLTNPNRLHDRSIRQNPVSQVDLVKLIQVD
ncbi:MAG: hypothetical protein ACPKQO_02660 [Nitrososphaeraceae archaeon]